MKILLDTDIGDDIDDAFALALAASLPELEIVGVTTVFRNTAQRAQLVQKYLVTVGIAGVPVLAGERLPYAEPIHAFKKDCAVKPENGDVCQWESEYGRYPVSEGAVAHIVQAAEQYGKDLTIVAIGPMTNLARAVQKQPQALKNIGGIVSMGGRFGKEVSEWNILCDPEAADIVYSSGINVYAVGLDVTMQCTLEKDFLEKFRKSAQPHNRLLTLWLGRWFDYFSFEKSVLHDPLTVATLVKNVCSFEYRYVRVLLKEKRGAIAVSPLPKEGYSKIRVATTVDRKTFYQVLQKQLL